MTAIYLIAVFLIIIILLFSKRSFETQQKGAGFIFILIGVIIAWVLITYNNDISNHLNESIGLKTK